VEAAHVKDSLPRFGCSTTRRTSWRGSGCCACTMASAPPRGRMLLGLVAPQAGASAYEWTEAVAAAPARSRVALTQTLQGLEAARNQVGTSARVTAIFRVLRPLVLSRYSEGPARVEDLDRLSAAAAAMTICPHGSPRSPLTHRWRQEIAPGRPISTRTTWSSPRCISQRSRVVGGAPSAPRGWRVPVGHGAWLRR